MRGTQICHRRNGSRNSSRNRTRRAAYVAAIGILWFQALCAGSSEFGPEFGDVPSDGHHVVRQGETLSEIASWYGLDTGCLYSWNGLDSAHVIHPGQRLRLSGTQSCMSTQHWLEPQSRVLTEWVLIGMSRSQAALARGKDEFGLFRIGDQVPAAGKLLRLDPVRQRAWTTRGVIRRGDR